MNQLATKLKEARKTANLSRADVAKQLPGRKGLVSASYVGQIESGTVVPGRKVLEPLCKILNLPYAEIAALAILQRVNEYSQRQATGYGIDGKEDTENAIPQE